MSGEIENKHYAGSDRLLVAVDCVIFGFDDLRLKLLLFKRKVEPYKGSLSLIGSFVKAQEDVSEAAHRVLEEHTGIKDLYLEELGSYGKRDRDPGARVVSIAHYALIRLDEHKEKLTELYNAAWYDIEEIPDLVMDHNRMVDHALVKLREKARSQPIGFELLPEKFTLPQLKRFYDAIYQKELDKRNFRKRILAMQILKKLDEKDKSASKKGAYLYRFDHKKYLSLMKKGFNFEL